MSATTSSSTSTATSTTSSSMSSSTAPSSTTSSISSQASALAHHSKESMMALGNRPTTMTCNGCAATLTIPPSTWQWKCSNNHINQYGMSKCTTCHEPRGASISWPAMLCDRCGTVTTVPGSEVESTLKGTFASLRSSLHGFIDPPKIFHCENCNTSLVVPQGPWVCQACTQVNGETVNKCMKCSQLKGAQRVLCGHCHKATSIPESGFVDILKSGTASLSRIVNKGWMDLIGTANVECPSCRQPVKLPTNITSQTTPTTTASSTTVPSSTTTATVSNSALPPPPHGVPVTEWSIPLVCDSCHHSFTVGRGSVTDPQANVSQTWKGPTGLADPSAIPSTTGGKGVDMQVALVAPPDLQTTTAATSTGSAASTKYAV